MPLTLPSGHRFLKEDKNKDDPSNEELEEYAQAIGVDPHEEGYLMSIVKEGWLASLPDNWRACQDDNGEIYYIEETSGHKMLDHPLDDFFRNKVIKARERHLKQLQQDKHRVLVQHKPPPLPPSSSNTQRRVSFQTASLNSSNDPPSYIPRPVSEQRKSTSSQSQNSKSDSHSSKKEEVHVVEDTTSRLREMRDHYRLLLEREKASLQRQMEKQLSDIRNRHAQQLQEERERRAEERKEILNQESQQRAQMKVATENMRREEQEVKKRLGNLRDEIENLTSEKKELSDRIKQQRAQIMAEFDQMKREEEEYSKRMAALRDEISELERHQCELLARQSQPSKPFTAATASIEELRREDDRLELKIRRTKELYKEYKLRKEAVTEMLYVRLYEARGQEGDENDITISMDVTLVSPPHRNENINKYTQSAAGRNQTAVRMLPPLRQPLFPVTRGINTVNVPESTSSSPQRSSSPKQLIHSTPIIKSPVGRCETASYDCGNLTQRFGKVTKEVCVLMNSLTCDDPLDRQTGNDTSAAIPSAFRSWDSFFEVAKRQHAPSVNTAPSGVPHFMLPQLGETITNEAHVEELSRNFSSI